MKCLLQLNSTFILMYLLTQLEQRKNVYMPYTFVEFPYENLRNFSHCCPQKAVVRCRDDKFFVCDS